MKNSIFSIILLLITSFSVFGQSHVLTYQSQELGIDERIDQMFLNQTNGPRLSDSQIDEMKKRENTILTISQVVTNSNKSTFEVIKKTIDPKYESMVMFHGDSRAGTYIKDIKNKTLYVVEGLLGENEMVKTDLSALNQWKLIDADTIINDFACKKAINTIDNAIAWYTLDIPVTEGPYHYCLLPGLIVFLNNGINKYELTDIVSIPDDEVEIEIPKKKKIVSWEKFKKIAPQFTKPGSKK